MAGEQLPQHHESVPTQEGAEMEKRTRKLANEMWEKAGRPWDSEDAKIDRYFHAKDILKRTDEIHSVLSQVVGKGSEWIEVGLGDEIIASQLISDKTEKPDSQIAPSSQEEDNQKELKKLNETERALEHALFHLGSNLTTDHVQKELKKAEERLQVNIDNVKTKVGPQGPKGDIGEKGQQGNQGLPGVEGPAGIVDSSKAEHFATRAETASTGAQAAEVNAKASETNAKASETKAEAAATRSSTSAIQANTALQDTRNTLADETERQRAWKERLKRNWLGATAIGLAVIALIVALSDDKGVTQTSIIENPLPQELFVDTAQVGVINVGEIAISTPDTTR